MKFIFSPKISQAKILLLAILSHFLVEPQPFEFITEQLIVPPAVVSQGGFLPNTPLKSRFIDLSIQNSEIWVHITSPLRIA
jgi:hypothetical protein